MRTVRFPGNSGERQAGDRHRVFLLGPGVRAAESIDEALLHIIIMVSYTRTFKQFTICASQNKHDSISY